MVAIPQTEKAFEELELDLQLKYKAQYRCSISAGLISESVLKASVHRSPCCSRGRQWQNSQLTSMRGGADPEWNKGMVETTLYGNGKRSKMSSYQQKIHMRPDKNTQWVKGAIPCPGESKIASRTCQVEEENLWSADRVMAWAPKRQVLRLGHTQGLASGHSRWEAKQCSRHWAVYLQPDGCCCHVWVATHPVAGRINKGDESEAVKIHFLSTWSSNQATKGGILARMREEKAEGSECYRKHQWNAFGRRRRRNTYI